MPLSAILLASRLTLPAVRIPAACVLPFNWMERPARMLRCLTRGSGAVERGTDARAATDSGVEHDVARSIDEDVVAERGRRRGGADYGRPIRAAAGQDQVAADGQAEVCGAERGAGQAANSGARSSHGVAPREADVGGGADGLRRRQDARIGVGAGPSVRSRLAALIDWLPIALMLALLAVPPPPVTVMAPALIVWPAFAPVPIPLRLLTKAPLLEPPAPPVTTRLLVVIFCVALARVRICAEFCFRPLRR